MNQQLYDTVNQAVTTALVFCDDTTTVASMRNRAHSVTTTALNATANHVRTLPRTDVECDTGTGPVVSLESVLYLLGERL